MDGFITMAAYDSTDEIKAKADVVCSEKNDEQTIQKTVDECVKQGNGVILYITKEALDTVGDDSADVLRTTWTDLGLGNGSCLRMENIQILLSHNQKPVRCIDLRRCDRLKHRQPFFYSQDFLQKALYSL